MLQSTSILHHGLSHVRPLSFVSVGSNRATTALLWPSGRDGGQENSKHTKRNSLFSAGYSPEARAAVRTGEDLAVYALKLQRRNFPPAHQGGSMPRGLRCRGLPPLVRAPDLHFPIGWCDFGRRFRSGNKFSKIKLWVEKDHLWEPSWSESSSLGTNFPRSTGFV